MMFEKIGCACQNASSKSNDHDEFCQMRKEEHI